jgi:hypothetical protein
MNNNYNFEFSILNVELMKICPSRKFFRNLKLNIQNLKFALAAVLMLFAGQAAAAPLTTGADFLLMTTGARPDGMGQAFSAVADDINTLSFNPAGLGNIRMPEVGYGYESFVAGIQYDFLGAALPLGQAGVLGLGYIDMGTAPFNSTPNPNAPPVSVEDRAFIAGWGRSFYDLHIGVAGKYIQRQLDTVNGNGWAVDLGLRYRPTPDFTLAASLMNLGPGIQLASLEPLPTLINTGLAWTAVDKPLHSLNLAANAAFNIATNTQQLGVGAEYWYGETVALRAGYLVNSLDTTFNPDGFAAGAGVRVSFIQLDYAFQPFNTLGMVHRFSGILRWDGPWTPGTEPNPPRYVAAREIPGGIEVKWERPQGPAQAFEVLVKPLNGNGTFVSRPVAGPPYLFPDTTPATLYRISVRTVNGGARSFPSPETYVLTGTAYLPPAAGGPATPTQARGVEARADAVGLQLSWDPVPGAEGYNLYRQDPMGNVQKASLAPKKDHRVWVTGAAGWGGSKWIVSAVEGGEEKVVGTCLWRPSAQELDLVGQAPGIKLHASPEPKQMIFLDWHPEAPTGEYSLFISNAGDGIYEFYEDLRAGKATALLKVLSDRNGVVFLIAPKSPGGGWLTRSNPAGLGQNGENGGE